MRLKSGAELNAIPPPPPHSHTQRRTDRSSAALRDRLKRSPGEAAAKPGLLGFGVLAWRGGGRPPHGVNVLQLRRSQRVLVITVQCKTREPKEKPREGTDLSGPYRVNESRELS